MTARRSALVTAASKGIGAACARELAARGFGLTLMARGAEVLDLARELQVVGVQADLSLATDLQRVVQRHWDEHGRIDGLVVSCGHPPRGDVASLDDEAWLAGFNLILMSVIRLCRLVTPLMIQSGGGSIVVVSSVAAAEPSLYFPVSSVMRAGLSAFVKLHADRFASAGVRINALLAGFIESYPISDEVRQRIPLGRSGRLNEIAGTAAFLLSPDAGFITGQSLRIDGGQARSV
ncbi:MAG TPA: SDR family oxidoreductase [Gemmatales bacterium]|nr:SDR family oxidoreductase [Gemmatales bacterium]HMP58426.1 SDR family oxidoreductase [Gemmatales bacterium]